MFWTCSISPTAWQGRRFAAELDLKPGLNLLIIPHLDSDSLGMNQVLQELAAQGIGVERKADLLAPSVIHP